MAQKSVLKKVADSLFHNSENMIWALAKNYVKLLPAESVWSDEDLFMEGMVIYCKIVEKFDVSKGTKFTTYLQFCVTNRFNTIIRREVKKYSFSYKAVPIHAFESIEYNGPVLGCSAPESLPEITLCHILSDELTLESKELLERILSLDIPKKTKILAKKIYSVEWIKIIAEATDIDSTKILKLKKELIAITRNEKSVNRIEITATA